MAPEALIPGRARPGRTSAFDLVQGLEYVRYQDPKAGIPLVTVTCSGPETGFADGT